jgi:2-polyprenyl-6-methoxyphenol hydroxylase-like FAD-dependent oxidoreductase
MRSIVVIGGSIAGCGVAAVLNPRYSVKVLERATQRLSGQGAGLFLPVDLFDTLKRRQYLKADFKYCLMNQRHFVIRDAENFNNGRTFWKQPLSGVSVHWKELFEGLREKVPDEIYFPDHEVTQIDCSRIDQCTVTLKNHETLTADLVICADGYSSIGRELICPDAKLCYPGYHAWRGLVPFSKIENPQSFQQSVPYFVNEKGHLLCYPVRENNQLLLNWVFFEKCSDEIADQFFIDKFDHSHQNSLRPGLLSDKSKRYLHDYASQALPQNMADIVIMTENPFIQRILDCDVGTFRKNRLIGIGDFHVLRPHVGAGAAKALQSALCLGDCLNNENYSLDEALDRWNEQQVISGKNLYALSHAMGDGLVLNPPDWRTMDEPKMVDWWQCILGGKKWYPENVTKNSSAWWNNPVEPDKETHLNITYR